MRRICLVVSFVVVASSLLACSGRQGPVASVDPEESALSERMERHFEAGAVLRDAAISGDDAGREEAVAWLMDPVHRTASPDAWDPYVADMQRAAQEASAAGDPESLAPAVGSIALACGSCHVAQRVEVQVAAPRIPAGEDVESEMLRHAWGAARMWEGLVGPNDDAWRSGVIAVGDGMDPAVIGGDEALASDVEILATRVQELALVGESAETLEERAVVYGQVLQTCASCHDFMGVGR